MDSIDDWIDYNYDHLKCISQHNWKDLSLQYVSDEITNQYRDQLDWRTIATNWAITDQFYNQFESQLCPYKHILRLRQNMGFISNNINII